MVVVWLGLCFVSAKHTLAAHKILAQEHHVHHTELYTNYIHVGCACRHVCYPMPHALHDASLSIIEVNAHQRRILHSFLSPFLLRTCIYIYVSPIYMYMYGCQKVVTIYM